MCNRRIAKDALSTLEGVGTSQSSGCGLLEMERWTMGRGQPGVVDTGIQRVLGAPFGLECLVQSTYGKG